METYAKLPPNFQEEMMNCELEFQEGINETIIRKLIYIYTLGMQYYNINEKKEYEKYYRHKLNNLLLNEKVITFLDTYQVDLSKKVDLNIFNKKEEKKESKNKENVEKKNKKITNIKTINIKREVKFKDDKDDSEIGRTQSFDLKTNNKINDKINDKHKNKSKKKIKKEDIKEYVTRKIKEVDIRLVSIDKQVSNNIVEQMSAFESNKRNKKVKKSQNSEKEEKKEEKGPENIINQFLEKKDSVDLDSAEIDLDKIPRRSLRRRGSSIGQTKLMKEIEEYVERNMKEMYKALEELRQSYAGEINEALETGFDDIADSLRNDLKLEEESLTAQYEEERMKQIELIREKNKKNLI